jgi:hypothetical protein
MKIRRSRRQIATLPNSRWLAYATAGAATALAGTNSAEAAIHYSGSLNVTFPPDRPRLKTFPLDQPGDYFVFARGEDIVGNSRTDAAAFSVFGIISASFRGLGYSHTYYIYPVSKLPRGENISAGPFTRARFQHGGRLASIYHSHTQWADRGVGFVGFKFNNGAGVQYGWARVRMVGDPEHAFKVLDYAYADPGEPIRAGEGSPRAGEDDQDMSDEQGSDEGSLGGLALGAVGLLAWRKSRSRTARYTRPQLPV